MHTLLAFWVLHFTFESALPFVADPPTSITDIDLRSSIVKVASLTQWLRGRGIHGDFFFHDATDAQEYMDPKHPLYAPKLAAADRDAKNTELRNVKQQLESVITERDEMKARIDTMTTAAQTANKTPTQTEFQTLLKLVLGMAMDAYQYDPEATKNKASGENKGSIKAALELKGISIDADTIRKYLNEAKKLL